MKNYQNYIVKVKCANCRMVKRMKFKTYTPVENATCPKCKRTELHPLGYYQNPNPGE